MTDIRLINTENIIKYAIRKNIKDIDELTINRIFNDIIDNSHITNKSIKDLLH